MALLETIRPDELLDFFIELAEIEQEEILWELYVPTLSNPFSGSKSFEEFKASAGLAKPKSKTLSKEEEAKAIAKAESILKITEFVEIKE